MIDSIYIMYLRSGIEAEYIQRTMESGPGSEYHAEEMIM